MIGRSEERRNLTLEEIERQNNIKNKKEKKRRSKSKYWGLSRIEGKKAVWKSMNSFFGKDPAGTTRCPRGAPWDTPTPRQTFP